ncbi:MAG: HEAT repeat domain-containing protein [Clostridia bacterium]
MLTDNALANLSGLILLVGFVYVGVLIVFWLVAKRYRAVIRRHPRQRAQKALQWGLQHDVQQESVIVAWMEGEPYGQRLLVYAWAAIQCATSLIDLERVVLSVVRHGRRSYDALALLLAASPVNIAPLCLRLLREADASLRTVALRVLARMVPVSEEFAPVLTELFVRGSETERAPALRALLQVYHGTPPLAILEAGLQDASWIIRAVTAGAAGSWQHPDVRVALARAMSDSNWWVRHNAARALGAMGTEGREALRQVASGPDSFARDAAVDVLRVWQLTVESGGRPPGGLVVVP